MEKVYVYNSKLLVPALTECEKRELIDAYCASMTELLENRGHSVEVLWDKNISKNALLYSELRFAIDDATPTALENAQRFVFGSLRFLPVAREIREIKKQVFSVIRNAPHIAANIASQIEKFRIKIATLHSPSLRRTSKLTKYKFLKLSRESTFVLWLIVDYKKYDDDIQTFWKTPVYLEVEQEVHGISLYYPVVVWDNLIKNDRSYLQIFPVTLPRDN
jgi:hypothetical protein